MTEPETGLWEEMNVTRYIDSLKHRQGIENLQKKEAAQGRKHSRVEILLAICEEMQAGTARLSSRMQDNLSQEWQRIEPSPILSEAVSQTFKTGMYQSRALWNGAESLAWRSHPPKDVKEGFAMVLSNHGSWTADAFKRQFLPLDRKGLKQTLEAFGEVSGFIASAPQVEAIWSTCAPDTLKGADVIKWADSWWQLRRDFPRIDGNAVLGEISMQAHPERSLDGWKNLYKTISPRTTTKGFFAAAFVTTFAGAPEKQWKLLLDSLDGEERTLIKHTYNNGLGLRLPIMSSTFSSMPLERVRRLP